MFLVAVFKLFINTSFLLQIGDIKIIDRSKEREKTKFSIDVNLKFHSGLVTLT